MASRLLGQRWRLDHPPQYSRVFVRVEAKALVNSCLSLASLSLSLSLSPNSINSVPPIFHRWRARVSKGPSGCGTRRQGCCSAPCRKLTTDSPYPGCTSSRDMDDCWRVWEEVIFNCGTPKAAKITKLMLGHFFVAYSADGVSIATAGADVRGVHFHLTECIY